MIYKDAAGNTLQVGDRVAVAMRYGNGASLEFRYVLDLQKGSVKVGKEKDSTRSGWTYYGRLVKINE